MTQNNLAAEFDKLAHHPTMGFWAGPLGVLGAYYAGEPISILDDDPLDLWATEWVIVEVGAPGTPRGDRLQREAEERHNKPHRRHWFIGKIPADHTEFPNWWGVMRRHEPGENVLNAVWLSHAAALEYVLTQIEGPKR